LRAGSQEIAVAALLRQFDQRHSLPRSAGLSSVIGPLSVQGEALQLHLKRLSGCPSLARGKLRVMGIAPGERSPPNFHNATDANYRS
jgi:hypothetical protein